MGEAGVTSIVRESPHDKTLEVKDTSNSQTEVELLAHWHTSDYIARRKYNS